MASHFIFNNCHSCGKKNVKLQVVKTVTDCPDGKYEHIHVYVACDKCKKEIWDTVK